MIAQRKKSFFLVEFEPTMEAALALPFASFVADGESSVAPPFALHFFGVASVSKNGYESPVVFPGAAGSFGE